MSSCYQTITMHSEFIMSSVRVMFWYHPLFLISAAISDISRYIDRYFWDLPLYRPLFLISAAISAAISDICRCICRYFRYRPLYRPLFLISAAISAAISDIGRYIRRPLFLISATISDIGCYSNKCHWVTDESKHVKTTSLSLHLAFSMEWCRYAVCRLGRR